MTDTEQTAHRVYDKYASGLRVTPEDDHEPISEAEDAREDGNALVGLFWALLAYAVVGSIVLIGIWCLR